MLQLEYWRKALHYYLVILSLASRGVSRVPECTFADTKIALTTSLEPADSCIKYWNVQRGGVRLARLIRMIPDSETCGAQIGNISFRSWP